MLDQQCTPMSIDVTTNSNVYASSQHQQSSSSSSSMTYTSNKHPNKLLESLNELRKREELYDVVILVGSLRIVAHRVVLSAVSPYFEAMFTGELVESQQREIVIRDVDQRAMQLLIDFGYTAKICVEETNVQSLLPAACLLQMSEIQDICCEFLKKQLHPSNCLGIRSFADTHACRNLLVAAEQYAHENFEEVKETEEFRMLPYKQLIEIISSDNLNTQTEEHVYIAVMNWLKQHVSDRRPYLSQVLQHVRLPLLTPKFLVGVVSTDHFIRNCAECRDLVDEAKNYMLLPQERLLMQGPRTRPRRPISHEVLFAVGGWCSGDAISSVERYCGDAREWSCVSQMKKRRCGVGVAVLDGFLYAVGGHDGTSYLNSVERYDPQTNQWCSEVHPTSTCRTSVGVAVLEGFLYAVGGQDGMSCLDIVERYDPRSNRWSKVSSMNYKRLGVAVAVLRGCLYAVGGSDGQTPWNSVEKYDPNTNRWSSVTPMNTRRKHLGCAVYRDELYAVGGRDDETELNTVERYNPQSDTWNTVVAMNSRRSGVGLAVVNGYLMAVGGFDGTSYLKTIEIYTADSNTWKQYDGMHYRRLGGGVGVVSITSR